MIGYSPHDRSKYKSLRFFKNIRHQPGESMLLEKDSHMLDHVLVAHCQKNRELGPCEMGHCDPYYVKMKADDREVGMEKQNDQFHDGIYQVKDRDRGRLGYALV